MYYITQHLVEAIEINFKRLFFYAKLSHGKSLPVSLLLISSEVLILPSSFLIDLVSKYWQKRGLPLMVHEFVSMELTPQFQSSFKTQSPIPNWSAFSFFKMQWSAIFVFLKNGHQGIKNWIKPQFELINHYPHYFCMVRHILESLDRANNLAIKHKKLAKKLGLRSPALICDYLVLAHCSLIFTTSFLDKLAYPLQRNGLPIIYQDVPHIPADEINYNV